MARMLIAGAGKVGLTLYKLLSNKGHKITLVDIDKELCNQLANQNNCTIINGDATDPSFLDELELEDIDCFFAVTGSEETNFLSSSYAKQAGSKKAVCRVASIKHAKILEKLGVESVVSELVLATELANQISAPIIHKLLNPHDSSIELVEKETEKKMFGKTVRECFSENYEMPIAMFKNGRFELATPETLLQEKSTLIIIRIRKDLLGILK